jgi:hypothetical protein
LGEISEGWEKGQIEKNVQDSRHRLWQRVPAFGSLAALNDWLADQCVLLWQQTKHPEQDTTIWDAWSIGFVRRGACWSVAVQVKLRDHKKAGRNNAIQSQT